MTMRWVCTVFMLIAPLAQAFVGSIIQMMMARIAVSAKAMASEAIYRKALRLTSTAKGSTSTGQLVNIMSTDTYTLLQFIQLTNLFVMIPVMLVICVIYCIQQLGALTWIAVGIYILMIIIQSACVTAAQPVRMRVLEKTDARVKLMNEVLTGIRVIKYYCWEKPFKGKVHDIRQTELNLHKKMTWLMNFGIDALMTIVPNIVPLVCFSLYPSVMGKPLTSSVAFTSFTLFNMLQVPFAMLPMIAFMFVQFKSSCLPPAHA